MYVYYDIDTTSVLLQLINVWQTTPPLNNERGTAVAATVSSVSLLLYLLLIP